MLRIWFTWHGCESQKFMVLVMSHACGRLENTEVRDPLIWDSQTSQQVKFAGVGGVVLAYCFCIVKNLLGLLFRWAKHQRDRNSIKMQTKFNMSNKKIPIKTIAIFFKQSRKPTTIPPSFDGLFTWFLKVKRELATWWNSAQSWHSEMSVKHYILQGDSPSLQVALHSVLWSYSEWGRECRCTLCGGLLQNILLCTPSSYTTGPLDL